MADYDVERVCAKLELIHDDLMELCSIFHTFLERDGRHKWVVSLKGKEGEDVDDFGD